MSEQHQGPQVGWGAAGGHIALADPPPPPDLTTAAMDRALIVERVYRYGWACDELREDWHVDNFTEAAT